MAQDLWQMGALAQRPERTAMMTDKREEELVNECNKLMERIDELGHAKNKLLDRVDQLDRRLEKREADCDKYRSLLFRAQPEIADDHIRQEVAEELK